MHGNGQLLNEMFNEADFIDGPKIICRSMILAVANLQNLLFLLTSTKSYVQLCMFVQKAVIDVAQHNEWKLSISNEVIGSGGASTEVCFHFDAYKSN